MSKKSKLRNRSMGQSQLTTVTKQDLSIPILGVNLKSVMDPGSSVKSLVTVQSSNQVLYELLDENEEQYMFNELNKLTETHGSYRRELCPNIDVICQCCEQLLLERPTWCNEAYVSLDTRVRSIYVTEKTKTSFLDSLLKRYCFWRKGAILRGA
jgi:hypothetical protein